MIETQNYILFYVNGKRILGMLLNSLLSKVGCIFPMVSSSEFCMGQYGDIDHREDAPHFI